jgi:hypothetical protein
LNTDSLVIISLVPQKGAASYRYGRLPRRKAKRSNIEITVEEQSAVSPKEKKTVKKAEAKPAQKQDKKEEPKQEHKQEHKHEQKNEHNAENRHEKKPNIKG